ncbi:MAG: hypothetical protein ACKODM_15300, partial [Cytophagales bacterium]
KRRRGNFFSHGLLFDHRMWVHELKNITVPTLFGVGVQLPARNWRSSSPLLRMCIFATKPLL